MTTKVDKIYHIDVESEGVTVANAYGDLDIIAYVARKAEAAIKAGDGQTASLTFIEVESIGGNQKRQIVSLNADAETVGLVLKGRITNERKMNRVEHAANDTTSVEPAPAVDAQTGGEPAPSADENHTQF